MRPSPESRAALESFRPSSEPPSDRSLSKAESERIWSDFRKLEEEFHSLSQQAARVPELEATIDELERTIERLATKAENDFREDAARDLAVRELGGRLTVVEDVIVRRAVPRVVEETKPSTEATAAVTAKEIGDKARRGENWFKTGIAIGMLVLGFLQVWPWIRAAIDAPDRPLPAPAPPALPLPNPHNPAGIP